MEDKCPICFESLEYKDKGTPNVCDHVFCFPCLEEWTKFGSFCPIDRKRYTKVINLCSDNVIQVRPRKRKRRGQNRVLYDISVYCEICKRSDHTNTLLLCDCCDLGYHCHCLNPPLRAVPPGLWHCPICVAVEEKLRKRKGKANEKGQSPQKKIDTEAKNHSKLQTAQKKEEHTKTELVKNNQCHLEKEKCDKPVVVVEKINILNFLPSASAGSSVTAVGNNFDDIYIRTENSENNGTVCADVVECRPASQDTVVKERPYNNNIVNDQETYIDKSKFQCLPTTSSCEFSKNVTPDNEIACVKITASDYEIPNNIKSCGESKEHNRCMTSSACSSSQKDLDNKYYSFATSGSIHNQHSWKKHISVHQYMILNSSFDKNMPFSVFEKLDDPNVSEEKYSQLKTAALTTYYSQPIKKCDDLCLKCLNKPQSDKRREKNKMWEMDKLLCKKFSKQLYSDTNKRSKRPKFYKCENKQGYSFRYSTLMHEIKKIEKQKWNLQKSQSKTHGMACNSKKASSDSVHSEERTHSPEKSNGLASDNKINDKLVSQKSYRYEKTHAYDKYVIANSKKPNINSSHFGRKNENACSKNYTVLFHPTGQMNGVNCKPSAKQNNVHTSVKKRWLTSNSYQTIQGSDTPSDSQSFYKNDLKHLVIRSDGSLFLNLPLNNS